MQIAQVTQKYQDAMKELANIQSPQFVRGMSEEEYQKEYAAYEQFLVNRAELEKQIQQNLQDEIKKIREDATKQQLDRFNQTLNEQYAEDLSKAADNERAKLELENEMLQKQIEARKAAGEKTYEQEAQLRANNLRLQQMDLDKELAQAELNHKSKYEIRKRYLEAELAAAQGNEDAIAQIQLEMAENEESLWEERIEKLQEYAEMASGFATAFNDLASALGERRAQEVEDQYSREEQALANMYANGQITEAQYNEKKSSWRNRRRRSWPKSNGNKLSGRGQWAPSRLASIRPSPSWHRLKWDSLWLSRSLQQLRLWEQFRWQLFGQLLCRKPQEVNTLRDPVMPLEECTLRRKEARPSLTRSRAACSCLFCQP